MIDIRNAICQLGFHTMEWRHVQGRVFQGCRHCPYVSEKDWYTGFIYEPAVDIYRTPFVSILAEDMPRELLH